MAQLTQIEACSRFVYDELRKDGKVSNIIFRQAAINFILGGKPMTPEAAQKAIDESYVTPAEQTPTGRGILVPLRYDMAVGGGLGNGTKMVVKEADKVTNAVYGFGGLYANETLSFLDNVTNIMSNEAVVKLMEEKIMAMLEKIQTGMAHNFYSSQATMAADTTNYQQDGTAASDYMYGMQDIVAAVTSVAFAGITKDENARWAHNVATTTSGPTFAVMQTVIENSRIGEGDGGVADYVMITHATLKKYKATQQLQQQYTSDDILKAGFKAALCDGTPLVADYYQTAGYAAAINTKHLKRKTVSGLTGADVEWKDLDPLRPKVRIGSVLFLGALITDHRYAIHQTTGINES